MMKRFIFLLLIACAFVTNHGCDKTSEEPTPQNTADGGSENPGPAEEPPEEPKGPDGQEME
jgi:hypothetical protein